MCNISVLLSYYYGDVFFKEQIFSIINQLHAGDEIIIRDDGSFSITSIEKTIMLHDAGTELLSQGKIKIISGKNIGVNNSFEVLLNVASNPICVFCDQDDVWLSGRLQSARENADSLLHCVNFEVEGSKCLDRNIIFSATSIFFRNKIPGCCMSGNREKLRLMIKTVPSGSMYDHALLFLGLLFGGKITFDPEPRVIYRRHRNTVTQYDSLAPNGWLQAMKRRLYLLKYAVLWKLESE